MRPCVYRSEQHNRRRHLNVRQRVLDEAAEDAVEGDDACHLAAGVEARVHADVVLALAFGRVVW